MNRFHSLMTAGANSHFKRNAKQNVRHGALNTQAMSNSPTPASIGSTSVRMSGVMLAH